jgi:hypothetical protein
LIIRLIPEQHRVATVRNDVVYHSGRGQLALALALGAQRVGAEEELADLPPTPVVDVVLWSPVVLTLTVGVSFTVLLLRQVRATGNGARMAAFVRHKDQLLTPRC